ncbi:MAG: HU family DNA-binding protein [Clostridia bacterium]|nr:HU family DNA-binding protein [Clostridia bacterium]MBQ4587628.1 HU family DNA-binding protein [Clostridia bacterium]MBQ6882788.1 HU family DNA-binding protein [Clostridia bacterium]MBR2933584.1 HU family DNA-binding protein [Clostridia bacterium]MBR6688312.1 HU family DNA-binding protein [Clostridia bacterium]
MNKSEFIRRLADKQGVTIKEAEENFVAFVDTLTDCLKGGDYVHISGFATFEVKEKDARDGVNPKTKERIVIPGCNSPTVKFSKAYKELFN